MSDVGQPARRRVLMRQSTGGYTREVQGHES